MWIRKLRRCVIGIDLLLLALCIGGIVEDVAKAHRDPEIWRPVIIVIANLIQWIIGLILYPRARSLRIYFGVCGVILMLVTAYPFYVLLKSSMETGSLTDWIFGLLFVGMWSLISLNTLLLLVGEHWVMAGAKELDRPRRWHSTSPETAMVAEPLQHIE